MRNSTYTSTHTHTNSNTKTYKNTKGLGVRKKSGRENIFGV